MSLNCLTYVVLRTFDFNWKVHEKYAYFVKVLDRLWSSYAISSSREPFCNFSELEARISRRPERCTARPCQTRDPHGQAVPPSGSVFSGCVQQEKHSERRILVGSGVAGRLAAISLRETRRNDETTWEINVNKLHLARAGESRCRQLI